MSVRATEMAVLVLLILVLPGYRVLSVEVGPVSLSVVDLLIMFGGLLTLTAALHGAQPPRLRLVEWLGAGLLLVGTLASFLATVSVATSTQALLSLVLKLLLVWLVLDAVRGPRDVRRLVAIYVVATGLVAAFALGHQYSNVVAGRPLQSIAGTFEARNEMIFYLVPGFLLSMALAVAVPSRWARIGYWFAAGLNSAAIAISRGRAGVAIAIVLGLGLMLFLSRRHRGRIKMLGRMVLFAFVMGVLATALAAWDSNEYYADFAARYSPSSVEAELSNKSGSMFVRLQILRGLMDAWAESPYVGIGIGTFKERSSEFVDLPFVSPTNLIQPHNTYLGLLAEAGPIGLTGFLILVAAGIGVFRRVRRYLLPERALMVGVGTAFVAVSLNLFTFDAFTRYGFWLFLGLCLVLARVAPIQAQLVDPTNRHSAVSDKSRSLDAENHAGASWKTAGRA